MKHFATALLLALGACTSGTPTSAVCPPVDPPTYDNFGRVFFADNCASCHSAASADCQGAPSSQNYDTEADIRRHAKDIDIEAAAGPAATNTSMPEGMTQPTDADCARLGEYLACLQAQ